MNIRFIAPDPRQRARPQLDEVLDFGGDQIAIACAFLTGGGVEVLRPHAERLRLPDSFVVVSWERPTTLKVLNELYDLIPGKLYVHLGSLTPVEKGVGRGIMHSKVFLARAAQEFKLWVGSHNLTASASQGVNCEAALRVSGSVDDQLFQDALEHLIRCRDEAILFDPLNPPTWPPGSQTLVIHAERHAGLGHVPWFVHFRPSTTVYDRAMRPPAAVWLFLYPPGSLSVGKQRPAPTAAFSGTLTALNFTERHPKYPGIPADWNDADYVIEFMNRVPCLIAPTPHSDTPSQGVFRVEAQADPRALWLSKAPVVRTERVVGETRLSDIDPEFQRFFTKQSISMDKLVQQQFKDLRQVVTVPEKEAPSESIRELRNRLRLPDSAELSMKTRTDKDDPFEFVYRAKYRA